MKSPHEQAREVEIQRFVHNVEVGWGHMGGRSTCLMASMMSELLGETVRWGFQESQLFAVFTISRARCVERLFVAAFCAHARHATLDPTAQSLKRDLP